MKRVLIISLIFFSILLISGISGCATEKCAKEGDKFSTVYKDQYLEHCCEGLTEWASGMDTRISIGNNCYETRMLAGSPIGTCINCGNAICESLEDSCNCAEDCKNGENSDYINVSAFCEDQTWKERCIEEGIKDLPLCSLC
jgi:hypothetical protein